MLKKIFIIFLFISLTGAGCSDSGIESSKDTGLETPSGTIQKSDSSKLFVAIKYREDPVNIEDKRFDYLNTSRSSFVNGAWYDSTNKYMVIKLSGTYYHYCNLDQATWNLFKQADSFGTYYNASIKGYFDCRNIKLPIYE